ncbi:hypothetical protein AGMMS50268_24920 [Spirochaetia bacterium]|nr:hypothetical protein AGMMS50268_24920 [Spirochaetia bacterium]
MLSFLREAPEADGKEGPLSMRRIASALCFFASIIMAFIAVVFCKNFLAAGTDWKVYILLFIPTIAFLFGGLILLYFTTFEAIKSFVTDAAKAAAEIKKLT